jgi:dolichol-phosphate mannosyltransferase
VALDQQPQISIVVPALNEGENLRPLAERIDAALKPAARAYELIIVDDNSRDATPTIAAELAKTYPLKLLVRTRPTNGLGGAVLHGLNEARGEIFVVMDADLQHPPERLPDLIQPLLDQSTDVEFVLGSRYIPGGSTGEQWGLFRKINSRLATLLARPFSGPVRDPMSGFFALRRSTFARGTRLTPLGYKIGLELMAKCRVRRVQEIPIHFAERERGQSKLSLKEQFRYLEHLSRLYDFYFPRAVPIAKFLIVMALAWAAGLGLYVILLTSQAVGPPWTTCIAYLAAIAVTAVFHARYVRTQREFLVRRHPWLDFLFSSLAEWAAASLSGVYLANRLKDPHDLELFFLPFGIAMLVRYVLRKEFLLDIRGLRREIRKEELD